MPDPPLAFGVRERERRVLLAHLLLLSADMSMRENMGGMQGGTKVVSENQRRGVCAAFSDLGKAPQFEKDRSTSGA
ncbi:hypothetical protein BJY52DRAFT_1189105 [Lactarius psammicola]|nr:hypothetical protein BJY52DRAFT_1189105 [Lactarius psammicola]